MSSRHRFGSTEAQHCTPNFMTSFYAAGNRESYRNTFVMLFISPVCTKQGEKSDCSNYRGIILARVFLNRLIRAVGEHHIPAREPLRLQIKLRYHRLRAQAAPRKMPRTEQGLYVTFVDLTKAFDTMSRKGLYVADPGPWSVLAVPKVPQNYHTAT